MRKKNNYLGNRIDDPYGIGILSICDYETYKGLRNITDEQLPDALEKDMDRFELQIK